MRLRRTVAGLLLASWSLGSTATARSPRDDASRSDVLEINKVLRVRVLKGRDIELEVRVASGEGFEDVAALVARSDQAAAIASWNGDRRPGPGEWVRVPLDLLSREYRRLTLQSLFPRDRHESDSWLHLAQSGVLSTYDEGLWQVARWFAGNGEDFAELMQVNGLSSPELREAQPVKIPDRLLHPAFQNSRKSSNGVLEYGTDEEGPYAGYRIKTGEALYTSVVVALTGRTSAEDVRGLADQIARRSGIRDFRDIPVGYLVKVPLDLLEPEYLPPGHPRRVEAEQRRSALAEALAEAPVGGTGGGLEGVLIVIDPGHGGRDLGTMNNGIWEHDYVYDVACRLKNNLQRHTAAKVRMTLEDEETGCRPSSADSLDANRQGTVLTHPTFLARKEGEAVVGVNLRWYLANSIYRKALQQGTAPDRVVFLSLHADSRHPSLRGVMVYVPGASYCQGTHGLRSQRYGRYEEVREKRYVKFSSRDRVRSEAVSREFADSLVDSFRLDGLPVQSHQPVRNRIIRGRQKFVPAVIRGNAIPTKVLVEMVNLSNPQDAALLGKAARRADLADALTKGLLRHFGEARPAVAATGAP